MEGSLMTEIACAYTIHVFPRFRRMNLKECGIVVMLSEKQLEKMFEIEWLDPWNDRRYVGRGEQEYFLLWQI